MKAGDAIIYDHRLMHRTPPNNSDEKRIAVSLNIIPEEAKAIHYYQHENDNRVELLEIEPDFFVKYTYNPMVKNNKLPEETKSIGLVQDYKPVYFTERQVMKLYNNKNLFQKIRVNINSWNSSKQYT
jgi:hypothetical protein